MELTSSSLHEMQTVLRTPVTIDDMPHMKTVMDIVKNVFISSMFYSYPEKGQPLKDDWQNHEAWLEKYADVLVAALPGTNRRGAIRKVIDAYEVLNEYIASSHTTFQYVDFIGSRYDDGDEEDENGYPIHHWSVQFIETENGDELHGCRLLTREVPTKKSVRKLLTSERLFKIKFKKWHEYIGYDITNNYIHATIEFCFEDEQDEDPIWRREMVMTARYADVKTA